MVARIRPISSAGNAGKYFYFLERNYECARGWQENAVTKELGFAKLTRENLEDVLNGKIKDGVLLGRTTEGELKHHPGQEITFSAPKSVSIMGLVAGDKKIIDAHEKAVSETLEYINRHLIYSRVQKDGIQSLEKTDNSLVAKFTHITARGVKDANNDKKPDPQLHTHALVGNATKCKDDQWRSIVFDKVYENQLNISELYRIELGRNIKDLGYNLITQKDSSGRFTFEIDGVPQMAMDELSQRRQNILEKAKEQGISGVKGLEYIAKSTREEKIRSSQEELLKDWQSRVNVKDLENVKQGIFKTGLPKQVKAYDLKDNLSLAISHLSEREAVWGVTELHKTTWQKAPLDYSIKEIEKEITANIESKKVLCAYDENNHNYTTRESLKLEQDVVKLMQDEQNKTPAIAREKNVILALEQSNLTLGQKDSAKLILTSKDRVVAVQGTAGTGKTTMLKQVKDIANENGIQLLGLAPTKAASDVLSEAVGIDGKTLKSFTMKYEGVAKGRGTKEGIAKMKEELGNKLVILDEASLASSKEIKNLLTVAKRLDFKVAMIGDVKQQHGVEAGKPFYYLQEHGMNTAIQRDIKRQEAGSDLLKAVYQSEKAVDSESASKSIYQALKAIGNNNITDVSQLKNVEADLGKKEFEPVTNKDLAGKVCERWKELKDKSNDILVIAPSNDLRDKISESMRAHYISGESESISVYTNTYKTKAQVSDLREYNGQEIVSFEKDIKNLGIKAGDVFKIDKINHRSDKDNIDLVRIGDNKKINWDPTKNNEFVTLYDCKNIDIAAGEKIRWTKNSKKHSFITNGETATIESIGSKKITIKSAQGQSRTISKEDIRFMDYGYTSSTYSSQGKTSDYVIGIVRAKEKFLTLSHQRSFYVILSRAAKNVHLVIDNYKDLIASLGKKDGDKTSSIEHQSDLDKNSRPIKVSPEANERASFIKQTISLLVKEYDNLEPIKQSQESLSSYIKESIKDYKNIQSEVGKIQEGFKNNSSYSNPGAALEKWDKLIKVHGLNKANELTQRNPEILGKLEGKKILFFNDKNRKEAISKIKQSINTLNQLTHAKDKLDISKRSVESFDKKFLEITTQSFNFKTKGISYSRLKKDIESGVQQSLIKTDYVDSKNIVLTISKRVEEKVIEYKNRYKKEPSTLEKINLAMQLTPLATTCSIGYYEY